MLRLKRLDELPQFSIELTAEACASLEKKPRNGSRRPFVMVHRLFVMSACISKATGRCASLPISLHSNVIEPLTASFSINVLRIPLFPFMKMSTAVILRMLTVLTVIVGTIVGTVTRL